ncbi:hypothetical protein, partial [Moorena sp. SIO3H5]|uniref:hypothetical protein n=1 Tax=Moorena sp. SIO3H5 TaxID=2607834 RepID=UPI0025EEEFC7
LQPWPFGHATRTTCQPATLAFRPRYANNLQPWPFGHATRTTCQPATCQPIKHQYQTVTEA